MCVRFLTSFLKIIIFFCIIKFCTKGNEQKASLSHMENIQNNRGMLIIHQLIKGSQIQVLDYYTNRGERGV